MVPGAQALAGTWRGTTLPGPLPFPPRLRSPARCRSAGAPPGAPGPIAESSGRDRRATSPHGCRSPPASLPRWLLVPWAPLHQLLSATLHPQQQASALSLSAAASLGFGSFPRIVGRGLARSLPLGREPRKPGGGWHQRVARPSTGVPEH